MQNKKLILSTIVAVGVFGILSASSLVYALAATTDGEYPAIIQNLAAKFNLDPDAVQTVFDDTRQAQTEERLDQAVEDGTITKEQKTLILAKQEEIQTKMGEIRNSEATMDEHHEQMQTLMDELNDWADQNDIPSYLLHPHMGHGRGGEGMMMKGLQ